MEKARTKSLAYRQNLFYSIMYRIAIKNLITCEDKSVFMDKQTDVIVQSTPITERSLVTAFDGSMGNQTSEPYYGCGTASPIKDSSITTLVHAYLENTENCNDERASELEVSLGQTNSNNVPLFTWTSDSNQSRHRVDNITLINDDIMRPYFCPIANCTSRFNRKFNMIQQYRSHAMRLKMNYFQIEERILKLKKSKKGSHMR